MVEARIIRFDMLVGRDLSILYISHRVYPHVLFVRYKYILVN